MNRHDDRLILYSVIGGPALLAWGLNSLKERRLLEDTPLSKTRSAAMGLVELSGTARPAASVVSPLSLTPCCWWRCVVKDESSRNNKIIKDVDAGSVFFLEDDTGRVLVDPLGAENYMDVRSFPLKGSAPNAVVLAALKSWNIETESLLGYRNITVLEHVIADAQPLYLMGEFCSLDEGTASYVDDRKQRFLDRLRAAKKDPASMAEADLNKDGIVDPEEWDAFRRKLEAAFNTEPADAARRPRGIVRAPQGTPFILASSPEQVKSSLGWAWPAIIGGIAFETLGVALLSEDGTVPGTILLVVALGLVGGTLLGLYYPWRKK